MKPLFLRILRMQALIPMIRVISLPENYGFMKELIYSSVCI